MKLQNKKTGEIRDLSVDMDRPDDGIRVYADDGVSYRMYNSLAELNAEWKDYEEPKEFWYICDFRIVRGIEGSTPGLAAFTREEIAKLEDIGNYFETEEEAEKAVEKLKARKRLIDHGLCLKLNKFQDHIKYEFKTGCISSAYDAEEALKDLDLLFGGEE